MKAVLPAIGKLVAAQGCQSSTKRVTCDKGLPGVRLVAEDLVSSGHHLSAH